MNNRTTFNNKELQGCISALETIESVMQEVMAGGTFVDACSARRLNMGHTRRIVANLKRVYDPEGRTNEWAREQNFLLTGIENLYCEVFGCDPATSEVMVYMPPDALETVTNMLLKPEVSGLFKREGEITYKYYLEDKTLEEIGHEYGVTRERIRQQIAKCIRKLRTPTKKKMLQLGCEYQREVEKLYEEARRPIIDQLVQEMLERDAEIKELREKLGVIIKQDVPIEQMGLSVRSYNCLKRSEINTLNDIIELDIYRLSKIRNLGRKSCEEIILKVREYYPDYLKAGVL